MGELRGLFGVAFMSFKRVAQMLWVATCINLKITKKGWPSGHVFPNFGSSGAHKRDGGEVLFDLA